MKKGKILVVGSVVIDTIFGENFYGGTGANIAYGLGLLGANPMLFSLVGKDFKKDFSPHLKKAGVTSRVFIDKNAKTANFSILINKKETQVGVWKPNAYKNISKTPLTTTIKPKELKKVSVAIFSTGTPHSAIKHLQEFKNFSQDSLTIFDPGQMIAFYSRKKLLECLKMANLFILNEMEYKQAKKILQKDPVSVCKNLNLTFIKTLGRKGSVIFQKGKKITIKAVIPKKVLDTTGAGDAYRAGLIFKLWQGKTLSEACAFGAKISARNVEFVGCQQYTV
ncbi:hypothetical protein K8Q98_00560 [Candidatus Nomurabacteria bacterium]|nr:hypothetical protein [Candidatus Nomurabacteria bacterium]